MKKRARKLIFHEGYMELLARGPPISNFQLLPAACHVVCARFLLLLQYFYLMLSIDENIPVTTSRISQFVTINHFLHHQQDHNWLLWYVFQFGFRLLVFSGFFFSCMSDQQYKASSVCSHANAMQIIIFLFRFYRESLYVSSGSADVMVLDQ